MWHCEYKLTLVQNSLFQSIWFRLDFNNILTIIFLIFKEVINGCQVSWTTYSFGGHLKIYPNYSKVHRIFF